MDIDVAYWSKVLAIVVLVPGLLFLFLVVIYVAFIGMLKRLTS